MAKISVVTPTNLGDGIKKNIETKKFDVAVDNQTIKINPEGDLIVDVDALTDDNLIDIQGNKFKINLKRLLWAMVNLPSNDIPATDFDVDFTLLRSSTLKGMTFTTNTIGNYKHLTALRHISGPEVVSVSDRAFENVKLTSIDLPKVKTIGERAFQGGNLTSVNLPEVVTLKNFAIYDNPITHAYLPKVKNMGEAMFWHGGRPRFMKHVALPFSMFDRAAEWMVADSILYVEPENIQEAKRVIGEYNTQHRTNIQVKSFADFPHPQS